MSKPTSEPMDESARRFLWELLTTPSPSGDERRLQQLVHSRVREFADAVEVDVHGNLLIGVNTQAKRRVMLAGHCDQIGFLVTRITADGYVHVEALGGSDEGVLLGQQVVIHTKNGPVPGVFGKKAKHLQTKGEKDSVPGLEEMWIDVGARDREEAESRIAPGDYITFELRVTPLWNDLVAAPGLDNKAGLFVILEALRQCRRERLGVVVYAVSTVQEELGGRGASTSAFELRPDIGVTVDVTHAVDEPGTLGERSLVPCAVGKGPTISCGPNTNRRVGELMVDAARRAGVPFQLLPSGGLAGNDSKYIQVAHAAVATVDVGIPNRNMHTQAEICSLEDIGNAVKLLVAFLEKLDGQETLAPFDCDIGPPTA